MGYLYSMPITPIDAKTNIVVNNESSRLRENQKNQEQGQTQLVTQNTQKEAVKFETVHATEGAEGKIIREDDQEAEREKSEPDTEAKKAK